MKMIVLSADSTSAVTDNGEYFVTVNNDKVK